MLQLSHSFASGSAISAPPCDKPVLNSGVLGTAERCPITDGDEEIVFYAGHQELWTSEHVKDKIGSQC